MQNTEFCVFPGHDSHANFASLSHRFRISYLELDFLGNMPTVKEMNTPGNKRNKRGTSDGATPTLIPVSAQKSQNTDTMTSTAHPYLPQTEMIRLVASDYQLLEVMSRFGIRLGFGSKSVAEVCEDSKVDTATFLTVVNFIVRGYLSHDADQDVDLPTLLRYLRHSHIYFLDFFLPSIRRKLLDGIDFRSGEIPILILKFFDEYRAEVESHMEYEDHTVFEYVTNLLDGKTSDVYEVNTYSHHHSEVSSKLKELKNIIIRYCPGDADANLLNAALYDIYRCENELQSHCLIEDKIFVPAVRRLEENIREAKR